MTREMIAALVGKLTRLAHFGGRAKGGICPFSARAATLA